MRKSKESSKLVELLIPRRDLSKQLDTHRENFERLKKLGSRNEAQRVKGKILVLEELLVKYSRNIHQPSEPKVRLYERLRIFKRAKDSLPAPKKS